MMPFYKNISDVIPFDVDSLVDISQITVITESPVEDYFVDKKIYETSILKKEFVDFMESKNLKINKVVVWHWLCSDPKIAHIDCNSKGEILPSALNWTLNNNDNRVQFYDMPDVEKTVMHGNEGALEFTTVDVTAYIPINIEKEIPIAIWEDRGPAIINTSVPHLIVAKEMRTSFSLQFKIDHSIEELEKKLYG